jgi:putative DNA primase/helicase
MNPLELVRTRLEQHGCSPRGNGDKFECQCPVHDDRTPSLTVGLGGEGKVLLHCHAGCPTDRILEALNLSWTDLYPDRGATRREIVATYPYTDEGGELLFQVVRFQPKDFRQRRPDGRGGWIWNLHGTRRVIYRLPAVLEAVKAERRIYVVEGEKDVHALERLGETATTNPMGAAKTDGNSKWRPEFSEMLAHANVSVIADSDKAGLAHARSIVKALTGIAATVELFKCPDHKDISDHLAAGRTLDDLEELAMPTREPRQLSNLLVADILAKNPGLTRTPSRAPSHSVI